jgi:protein disulfide-isomerase
MSRTLSIFIFSVLLLMGSSYAQEEDSQNENSVIERQKRLFSSSIKESLKEACRLKTKRQVYWTDNFHNAVKVAKEKQKYLLLAFVGSDWCPWSQKFENEVLTQAKFAKALKEDLIFVWVDFPENAPIHTGRKETNQYLREKYHIKELPTLILLDHSDEQVCKLGYLPLEADSFADHIKALINDYNEMKEALETMDLTALAQEELQSFYAKAKNLGCNKFQEEFMQAGLKADKGTFFLLERYAGLLETAPLQDPSVLELRKAIAARDPKNEDGSHLKLAMLEFEKILNQPRKKDRLHAAVDPLIAYIKEYGKRDQENLWRVEMMIAQYFFSKGIVAKALQHAAASYDSAPDADKEEIAQSIDYLKTQKTSE